MRSHPRTSHPSRRSASAQPASGRLRSGMRATAVALLVIAPTTACETSPTGEASAGEAAISGWVASSASEASRSGAETESENHGTTAEAESVVVGWVASDGSFQALGEAQVEVDGTFRIEGVPAGWSDLVIIARAEGGAEVGRVLLHEETRANAEHRTHPIDGRSTLHAHVFSQVRADGGTMSAAELALFVHADGGAAAQAAASPAAVAAIASAAIQAQTALEAVLAAEGIVGFDAAARGELLAVLVSERDRARDAGAGAQAQQRTFVAAAVRAWTDAAGDAGAVAIATAAAGSAFDAVLEAEGATDVRLELARQAILVNLEARKQAVAAVGGNPLGLATVVLETLAEAEVAAQGAATVGELQAGLEAAHTDGRDRIVSAGVAALGGLAGLGTELFGETETAFETALAGAALWSELEAAASAQARIEAAAAFRSQVRAAAEALVASLPEGAGAGAGVSAEVMAALLVAFGAGPDCG